MKRIDYGSWRGTVGVVMPANFPGIVQQFLPLFPEGVAAMPVYVSEQRTMPEYEQRVAELAALGVDLIYIGGAPFFALGYEEERRRVTDWQERFGVPIYTMPIADCEALRALGMQRFVAITYFPQWMVDACASYLREVGFDCLGFANIGIPMEHIQGLPPTEVYRFARQTLLAHPEADGIYMVGAWNAYSVLDMIEGDFQLPTVLSTAINGWALQKRLHVRQPMNGYGRLLRELP